LHWTGGDKLKKTALFFIVSILAGTMGFAMSYGESGDESLVIGRLIGTYQELPGYFQNNMYLIGKGKGEVEFTGFKLVNRVSGRKFIIRPRKKGFFRQELPTGDYDLVRIRKDRPGYKENKIITILPFKVPTGSLVNIGTLQIVLDGKPDESLFLGPQWAKGTYTYQYRYERIIGEKAYEAPFHWSTEKKPEVAAGYGERVINIERDPEELTDRSKVVLREPERWWDR
jgi:hypothetical protein